MTTMLRQSAILTIPQIYIIFNVVLAALCTLQRFAFLAAPKRSIISPLDPHTL